MRVGVVQREKCMKKNLYSISFLDCVFLANCVFQTEVKRFYCQFYFNSLFQNSSWDKKVKLLIGPCHGPCATGGIT